MPGPMEEMTWFVKFGSYRPAPLRVSFGSSGLLVLLVADMIGDASFLLCSERIAGLVLIVVGFAYQVERPVNRLSVLMLWQLV